MISYIINRLLSIVFTFFFISILVFILMHAIPGGPFDPVDMPLSDSAKAKILTIRFGSAFIRSVLQVYVGSITI